MSDLRYVSITQLYFRMMWWFTLLLYILIPLGGTGTGLVYKGIFGLTIGSFGILAFTGRLQTSNRKLISFCAICFVIFASLLSSSGAISFDNQIMGIAGFLEMFIAIMMVDMHPCSKSEMRFVFFINILISIIFCVFSVSSFAYRGQWGWLTLGFANPNMAGIYILFNQMILVINLGTIRRFIPKITIMGIIAYEFYLIYRTQSRACLLVSLVIVVYFFVAKQVRIPKIIVVSVMLFPLLFLVVYATLYSTGRYSDVMILGKELFSGRESYFLLQLESLKEYLWIGDVRVHAFSNMHNGPLAVMSGAGVIGYLFHFLFYKNAVLNEYSDTPTTIQNIALIGILGSFLHASAEAAMFVGGAQYSILVATLFWIMKGVEDEEIEYQIN